MDIQLEKNLWVLWVKNLGVSNIQLNVSLI